MLPLQQPGLQARVVLNGRDFNCADNDNEIITAFSPCRASSPQAEPKTGI